MCGESCDRCVALDVLQGSTRGRRLGRSAAYGGRPTPGREGARLELDQELFERLRAFRRELAEERGVPAYVVFSEAVPPMSR